MKKGIYCKYIKRPLDVVCAVSAMLAFCWLFAIVAILVRVKLGSPVIFKQKRTGKNGCIFTLYKFRTMTDAKDMEGNPLPDKVRLTPFGRVLRSTSLDELPELFNILKGDMSVVGPRPLLASYLPYYTEEELHRHDVRPGLTGLAQISGRNFLAWEDIFCLDLSYVGQISFPNDCRIVLITAKKVLLHKDIADATDVVRNRAGELFMRDGAQVRTLHRPLNIERGEAVYSAK